VVQPTGSKAHRGTGAKEAVVGTGSRGRLIREGGDAVGFDRTRTPFDYFFAVFPRDQLTRVTELTTAKLESRRLPPTSPREIQKFF